MGWVQASGLRVWAGERLGSEKGTFVMAVLILALGFYILYPVLLIFVNSFNVAHITDEPRFGLENWRGAFAEPGVFTALGNTFLVYFLHTAISFPLAVAIAWVLARVRIPFSYELEFMFWVSYFLPDLATTIGWMLLLDPDLGLLNVALRSVLPVDTGPFNIYSLGGIIWAHLMGNSISAKVMLLTPAFRNMDLAMEEAAMLSGASHLRTMLRVTLPLMLPPMLIVFMLNVVRVFQTFETEQLLGVPIGFYVYSTKIYDLARASEPPQYGQATALASLTLLLIALIIPLQQRLLQGRQSITVTGRFRPGLVDLGIWRYGVFGLVLGLVLLLNLVPLLTLLLGSFMTRVGFFQISPLFTLKHWQVVLSDNMFRTALTNTFLLSLGTSILSPFLFSFIGYVLVRTRWRGRALLDGIIWSSAAVPGMLAGLGLLWMFLGTPFLRPLYGTIWALLLVMLLQGKLTGIQISKGVFLQVGQDLEDAAKVSGASWLSTYFRVWLPIIAPTLVLLGTMHFVLAAQTTSPIILLASRETVTLSILALELASSGVTMREEAGIISLFIVAMTMGVALVARAFGLRLGVQRQ